jgi:prepilin peptidase CpaA
VLASPAPVAWLGALAVAAAALAVGLGLFAARAMGGGDVKLIAAIALWAGPALVLPFLFVVALAGGALSLVMLSAARLRPVLVREAVPQPLSALRVPYGVAVAAGGLFVASRLLAA